MEIGISCAINLRGTKNLTSFVARNAVFSNRTVSIEHRALRGDEDGNELNMRPILSKNPTAIEAKRNRRMVLNEAPFLLILLLWTL
jgi:hypothetical protein